MCRKLNQTVLILSLLFGLSACDKKERHHYNGALLLKEKCSSCHNLDMPPKTSKDEKAPPMMAVAFHIKDFMKVSSPSDKKPKFIEFFKDFVLNPSKEKSFCDKKSLQEYGLMPSQKGSVTKEEVGAIAKYIFDFYDSNKFLQIMKAKAAFEALPKGEQLAVRKGCLTCHAKIKTKVAPSFKEIAKKSENEIKESIKNGSRGKWKGFERMAMPSFGSKLTKKEENTLIKWIKSFD